MGPSTAAPTSRCRDHFAGRAGLAFAATVGLPSACVAQVGGSAVVARSGDTVPGHAETFTDFQAPSLNDAGQAAFVAGTSGPNDGTNIGIYRGSAAPGTLVEILHAGDAAPEGGVILPSFTSPPALNLSGQAAFSTETPVNSPGVRGVFRGAGLPGSLAEIARTGDPAPGGADTLAGFRPPALNAAGQAAFSAGLGTHGTSGIYRSDGLTGALTKIVQTGDGAPDGVGTTGTLVGTDAQSSQLFGVSPMNTAGKVAFLASIAGSTFLDNGVFVGDGTTLGKIARRGETAPGGGTFGRLGYPDLNDAGDVAFNASVDLPLGGTAALFRGNQTALTEIVRAGDPAPGGRTLGSFSEVVDLNSAGQVLFGTNFAELPSGGVSANHGLYRSDGITTTRIASVDTTAPDGTDFLFFSGGEFAMNDLGQVVFTAAITNLGDQGLYFFDDQAGLTEITRVGASFQGSTVVDFAFSGNTSSALVVDERTGLNNLGQVAWEFRLANGTQGVAVFTVPEPAGSALLALGALTLVCRRRRRAAPTS